MSSELLNALESRVSTAVDTIEDLRSEIKVLKEERQLLENKLRELLSKIERSEGLEPGSITEPESMPGQSMGSGSVEAETMGADTRESEASSMLQPTRQDDLTAREPLANQPAINPDSSSGYSSEPSSDSTFSRSNMGYGPMDDNDY